MKLLVRLQKEQLQTEQVCISICIEAFIKQNQPNKDSPSNLKQTLLYLVSEKHHMDSTGAVPMSELPISNLSVLVVVPEGVGALKGLQPEQRDGLLARF